MSPSKTTKMVWSLSGHSFEKTTPQQVAKMLVAGPQDAVRVTYSESMKTSLVTLRKELTQNYATQNIIHDPSGWMPFLVSLVGRRAVARVEGEFRELTAGEEVEIHFIVDLQTCVHREMSASQSGNIEICVTSEDMLQGIEVGSALLLSYGDIKLSISQIVSTQNRRLVVKAKVIEGGALFSGAHACSQDMSSSLFPLLKEDQEAIKECFVGIADYVIIGGIKSEAELFQLKYQLVPSGQKLSERHPSVPLSEGIRSPEAQMPPRFIYKVDSKAALELLPQIIKHIDGVLLSRSELGMSVHPHELPIIQKELIAKCNQAAKIVIIASQLMFSMKSNPTPTRAEVSDVANAVADGADALLLAEDVTEGPYAKEVAQVTGDALRVSEVSSGVNWHRVPIEVQNDDDAVAFGALQAAEWSHAKAIVCLTEGGYTAIRLSSMRAPVPVVAVTFNNQIMRQLNLARSVTGVVLEKAPSFDEVVTITKNFMNKALELNKGDNIVFVSLSASSVSAKRSNLLSIQVIS